MARTIGSIIGGRPAEGGVAGTISSPNPSRLSDVVAEVTLADAATFAAACATAKQAQPLWADVPAPVRGRAIAAMGRIVEANKESLARLVTRELGKPYGESLGEVQEIIDTCDFFLGEGRRMYGQTVPSEMPDKQLFTFRVPALVTGNTVVWKPAEYAAASAMALFELLQAAGLPDGVLNIVFADGEATFGGLQQALEEGTLDKIGFTGSTVVGSRIGELAGRHLQAPCLELGGKNPMVVTPSADIELAVEGALFSGFGTAGQRCTSLGTVIVQESIHDEFLARLAATVSGAAVGDPAQDVVYGPMLDQKFASRFEEYLGWVQPHHKILGSSGVGRISAGNPRAGFVGDPGAGLFYHPTIVDGLLAGDALFQQETFGPIVGVASYGDLDQAVAMANAPGYGLSSSIYSRDPREVFAFRRGISAGMVSVNNSTSGAEAHLPFGGNGKSGNGSRQSGMWVLDQFTRWQSMNWDYSGRLQKAQMDVTELTPDESFRLAD